MDTVFLSREWLWHSEGSTIGISYLVSRKDLLAELAESPG